MFDLPLLCEAAIFVANFVLVVEIPASSAIFVITRGYFVR